MSSEKIELVKLLKACAVREYGDDLDERACRMGSTVLAVRMMDHVGTNLHPDNHFLDNTMMELSNALFALLKDVDDEAIAVVIGEKHEFDTESSTQEFYDSLMGIVKYAVNEDYIMALRSFMHMMTMRAAPIEDMTRISILQSILAVLAKNQVTQEVAVNAVVALKDLPITHDMFEVGLALALKNVEAATNNPELSAAAH